MASIVTDLMEHSGYSEFQRYLDQQLRPRRTSDWTAISEAVVVMVNICENCPELPRCLKQNLPRYLKQFQSKLNEFFSANPPKQDAAARHLGTSLIAKIRKIQDNKLNTQYFFRNEIHHLLSMVENFCA